MPCGNESTWDQKALSKAQSEVEKSPMPFGNKSTWDTTKITKSKDKRRVTNAFRQQVHLGQLCRESHAALGKCVTNAFRQQVHLGLT